MAKPCYEVEFYKLVKESELVSEYGWINKEEFCVWVDYINLHDFMEEVKKVFGYGMFDEGGFDANMQGDCLCIDVCEMLDGYLSVEDVFPYCEENKH